MHVSGPVAATVLTVGLWQAPAAAEMIRMQDFIRLSRGMSEAEILYRVGPFDHESVSTDYHNNVIKKVWYYIPTRQSSDAWITEIEFDRSGTVQSLDRYRARR